MLADTYQDYNYTRMAWYGYRAMACAPEEWDSLTHERKKGIEKAWRKLAPDLKETYAVFTKGIVTRAIRVFSGEVDWGWGKEGEPDGED